MEALRPNEQRAKNAVLLIWICLMLEIVNFISSFFQYILLQNAANGEAISIEEANSNDLREQVVAVVFIIAYIISAVTFIMWFRRAYYNLHLRVNRLSHSEGWAAGSWFVPIVSWFRPYHIMQELFEQTILFFKRNDLTDRANFATVSLGLWWGLWIANNFLGQFIFRYGMKAETIDELIISTVASMVGNCIGVPLAFITIKVIKEYSSVETDFRNFTEPVEDDAIEDTSSIINPIVAE